MVFTRGQVFAKQFALILMHRYPWHPYFTDEETEAKIGWVTHQRSHSAKNPAFNLSRWPPFKIPCGLGNDRSPSSHQRSQALRVPCWGPAGVHRGLDGLTNCATCPWTHVRCPQRLWGAPGVEGWGPGWHLSERGSLMSVIPDVPTRWRHQEKGILIFFCCMKLLKNTKVTHASHNKAEVYKENTSSSPTHTLFSLHPGKSGWTSPLFIPSSSKHQTHRWRTFSCLF